MFTPALGMTRTCVRRNHAFIAPDSHVTSALPGWTKTGGIVMISPQMGARFCMFVAKMEKGATAGAPSPEMQRFVYVLEGALQTKCGAAKATLAPGGYAYFPPDAEHSIVATKPTRAILFEKPFTPSPSGGRPRAVTGRIQDVAGGPFLGDEATNLKILLPEEPAFDMAVNLFAFQPGTTLPFVETHVMEHGLLLVQGGGVYRLDDQWYPIQAGDAIWMGPYCPQWFVAAGKTPSAYLYYKDVQRDPLTMR